MPCLKCTVKQDSVWQTGHVKRSNLFWLLLRQKCINFKNPFTSKQNDNSLVKQDHHTCFRLSLFSNVNISQGSVATLVTCGGIFNENFIANFLASQPVKELWKSVDIWRSYRKSKKGDVFWDTVYIYIYSVYYAIRTTKDVYSTEYPVREGIDNVHFRCTDPEQNSTTQPKVLQYTPRTVQRNTVQYRHLKQSLKGRV